MIRTKFYRKVFELNGHPIIAKGLRSFAQSKMSRPFIASFAKVYKLNMEEATRGLRDYGTLHDIFTRELKPDARPVADSPDAFVSPCDAYLSVVDDLTPESTFMVKGQDYTVEELLGSAEKAAPYAGGKVLIFYLSPTDYHRVHVPIDASVEEVYTLGRHADPVNELGLTHGVRPLTRNYRLVSRFDVAGSPLAHVMVGALNVNSIVRTNKSDIVHRGDPYGYFSFGSTVVVCVPQGKFSFTREKGPVKMGEEIGKWHS
jgi:phosphatidylserine decarboxylase